MADGQHKLSRPVPPAEMAARACPELSRRALLGAVCAAPLVRHPGLGPGPRNTVDSPVRTELSLGPGFRRDDMSAQSSAVLKWDRALARFAAAEAAIAAAAGAPDHVYDPIGARHHATLRRLLRTPAPGLAALARKLDLALDERTVEFDGNAAAMKRLKQDAHRLAAIIA
jgi:hypothetical protein